MTTYGAAHAESWAISLRDNIFPAVILFYEKKGVTGTVDELFNCLSIVKPSTSFVPAAGPEMPSYLGGSSSTSHQSQTVAANGGGGNGGGKGKSNKEPYTGPTCQYVFTKGQHKNEYCGAACAPGNPKFCKACSRKKAAGGQGSTTSTASTGGGGGAQDNSDGDSSNVLDAVQLDESRNLYREVQCNLLIQQDKGNTFALGVITDPDNLGTQLRPLNEKEKLFCAEKNITIADQDLGNKPTAAPGAANATSSAAPAAAPNAPAAASNGNPIIPGLGDVEGIIRGLQQKGK